MLSDTINMSEVTLIMCSILPTLHCHGKIMQHPYKFSTFVTFTLMFAQESTIEICLFVNFRYSKADFMFVRSWLPSIFFSGGVTMGNIGRQLAMVSICCTSSAPHPVKYY